MKSKQNKLNPEIKLLTAKKKSNGKNCAPACKPIEEEENCTPKSTVIPSLSSSCSPSCGPDSGPCGPDNSCGPDSCMPS